MQDEAGEESNLHWRITRYVEVEQLTPLSTVRLVSLPNLYSIQISCLCMYTAHYNVEKNTFFTHTWMYIILLHYCSAMWYIKYLHNTDNMHHSYKLHMWHIVYNNFLSTSWSGNIFLKILLLLLRLYTVVNRCCLGSLSTSDSMHYTIIFTTIPDIFHTVLSWCWVSDKLVLSIQGKPFMQY